MSAHHSKTESFIRREDNVVLKDKYRHEKRRFPRNYNARIVDLFFHLWTFFLVCLRVFGKTKQKNLLSIYIASQIKDNAHLLPSRSHFAEHTRKNHWVYDGWKCIYYLPLTLPVFLFSVSRNKQFFYSTIIIWNK